MLKKITILKLICFFAITIATSTSFAQYTGSYKVLPRPTSPRINAVNDFANILPPLQKEQLEQKLRRFYDSTSNEIVVITLPTLNDYDVEEVAYAYAKSWKIGNQAKDNGIVLLVSLEPKKIRIEVGKGLEGALPDGMAGVIIRREIAPYLKQSKYFEAFDFGTTGIISATKGEYEMDDPSDRRDSVSQDDGGMMRIIIMIAIIFIILAIINKRKGGGGNGGMLTRRGYKRWGGPTIFDYGPWMGGGNTGGGIFGGGGSSGGGDFGGFGGGDFGGGGASGDW
jgi:uncharacterized protein